MIQWLYWNKKAVLTTIFKVIPDINVLLWKTTAVYVTSFVITVNVFHSVSEKQRRRRLTAHWLTHMTISEGDTPVTGNILMFVTVGDPSSS